MAELTRSDNVLSDLFSDDGSRRNVTVYLTVLTVGLLYHASVFWFIMGDEIQAKDEQITYAIEFEETPSNFPIQGRLTTVKKKLWSLRHQRTFSTPRVALGSDNHHLLRRNIRRVR